ncbi:MAG: putative glycoside hydrolase, partial [Nitriliruptoraceae bacterium]
VVAGEEVEVAGTSEPGATIEVEGEQTEVDEDGAFSVTLEQAPQERISLVATDRAGNQSDDGVDLVTVPSRVEVDHVRAVHVSFCAWTSPSLKEPILELIDEGLINAVQLDLKDESGTIGFHTTNEFAAMTGAAEAPCNFDLDEAVAELHDLGVPVIGRIVAFADPQLAQWAWEHDERDMVMQDADGEMYVGRYAGFANFAHEDVVDYNLDIAEEAAAAGVDHILWDYIRKPDGVDARFPGLEGEPGDAVLAFTERADERVTRYGAQHGASVYGVSGDRPKEVAQPIEQMAHHLDYVAPMLYPSHWGPGEYDVADPLMQPYDMISAGLEAFFDATEGKRARVTPWLEDSNYPISLGYPDRRSYVEKQIEATYDAGLREWLLWDSSVRYTEKGMLQPDD